MDFKESRKFTLLIFILIFFLLSVFTFLVPPFQKPDEYGHLIRSLSVSKGALFCSKLKNNNLKIENQFIDLFKSHPLAKITPDKKIKLPFRQYLYTLINMPKDFRLKEINIDHLCSFPFISYIPQALSLKFIMLFRPNAYLAFFFARFAVSVISFFWFYYLYQKINLGLKLALLFSFTLPMSLHQISSFSYDGVHIMLNLTFFTFFVNTLFTKKISRKSLFLLFSILLLFLLAKRVGYEALFFLIFLIPFNLIADKRKEYIIKIVGIAIIFFILSVPFKYSGQTDLSLPFSSKLIDPEKQLEFVSKNPINFLIIIAKTTLVKAPVYAQGLIGLFGWLEYGLDPISYLIYGLFFVYIIFATKLPNRLKLSKLKFWLLFFTLFTSYIFIQFLTYLFWTPVGEKIADGVQGRYFIVFVPWIFFFLLQFKKVILQKIFFFLILIFLAFSVSRSVFTRYFY